MLLNVATVLAAAGASFPDKMPRLLEGIVRAAARLGVAAPDVPEYLIEVEATAVVD